MGLVYVGGVLRALGKRPTGFSVVRDERSVRTPGDVPVRRVWSSPTTRTVSDTLCTYFRHLDTRRPPFKVEVDSLYSPDHPRGPT